MDTVRWGIIGVGDVTEVKSGPAFQKAEGSSLVAVMRRTTDKARDYAERHGVPRWYDDAERLIDDREVDAVYVATPPASHKAYVLAAANAGKPVYVEKPMGLDATECGEMLEACRHAGVPLFAGYYRRALPRFVLIRSLLRAQLIGDLRSAHITLHEPPKPGDDAPQKPWRLRPEISGGGYFVDLASHTLDFLDHVLGPVLESHGLAVNQAGLYEPEDTVSASFRFQNGVIGTGNWCFVAHDRVDSCEIVGSMGRIVFSSFDESPVRLDRANETGERVTREFPVPNPRHVHLPLVQTIVDELRGKGRCPSSGESATRTTAVMERILASYYHEHRSVG